MTTYIKLRQAKNCAVAREQFATEGEALLQHYVVEECAAGEAVTATGKELANAVATEVTTVAAIGREERVSVTEGVAVLRSGDGSIWLDEDMWDEVFN